MKGYEGHNTKGNEMNDKKAIAEQNLSNICGTKVEITVRDEREFTFSFDGQNESAVARLRKFFGLQARLEVRYDAECDFTCVYASV